MTFHNRSKLMFASDFKLYHNVNCDKDIAILQSGFNLLLNGGKIILLHLILENVKS